MKNHLLRSLALAVIFAIPAYADPQIVGANFVDSTRGNGGPGTVYAGTGVLGETFVAFNGPGEQGIQSEGPIPLAEGVSLTLAQNDTSAGDYFQYSGNGATDLFSNALIDNHGPFLGTSAGTGFTFTFSGLQAGHNYDVAVYSSDNVSFTGGSVSWQAQGNAIGTTTGTSGAAFVAGENYLIEDDVVANSSGDIVLASTSHAAFTQVSAVSISEVPEPSTYLLLGLGGLALMAARRRFPVAQVGSGVNL